MKTSSTTRIAERYLSAGGEIPQRVKDATSEILSVLRDWGVPGRAKAFNSGNVGVKIDAGDAGTLWYFDQPGVVGLEDHMPAFVSFGTGVGKQDVKVIHNDQRFGDVTLTRNEWEDAWRKVMFALEKRLADAGYSIASQSCSPPGSSGIVVEILRM